MKLSQNRTVEGPSESDLGVDLLPEQAQASHLPSLYCLLIYKWEFWITGFLWKSSSKTHVEVLWNDYIKIHCIFPTRISSSSEPQKNIPTVLYHYNLYRVLSLSLTFKFLKWLVHICVPQPRIIGSHVHFMNKLMSEGMNPFLPSWSHFWLVHYSLSTWSKRQAQKIEENDIQVHQPNHIKELLKTLMVKKNLK